MAIQITLLNIPTINDKNGYNIEVAIDGESTFPTDLSKDELLQIGAILINAGNNFIRHCLNYERT